MSIYDDAFLWLNQYKLLFSPPLGRVCVISVFQYTLHYLKKQEQIENVGARVRPVTSHQEELGAIVSQLRRIERNSIASSTVPWITVASSVGTRDTSGAHPQNWCCIRAGGCKRMLNIHITGWLLKQTRTIRKKLVSNCFCFVRIISALFIDIRLIKNNIFIF